MTSKLNETVCGVSRVLRNDFPSKYSYQWMVLRLVGDHESGFPDYITAYSLLTDT